MAISAKKWGFTRILAKMAFFGHFGIPRPLFPRGFTSTPRAGALSRLFRGSEVPEPGETRETSKMGIFADFPEIGISGLPGPEGLDQSRPGTGPRREGLM